MKKYYLDKEFYSRSLKTYISYESRPLDDKYFESEYEARTYAESNLYRLEKREAYSIYEVEFIEEETFIDQITKEEFEEEHK